MKRDFKIPIHGHVGEIVVPGFARVDAQFLAGLAGQQVPGTFDVLGGVPRASTRGQSLVAYLSVRQTSGSEETLYAGARMGYFGLGESLQNPRDRPDPRSS